MLSKKEVLLVFDNCDGLLGDDTMGRWCKLLGRIMRSGDGVHAIVTSRNDIDATEFAGVKMGVRVCLRGVLAPDADRRCLWMSVCSFLNSTSKPPSTLSSAVAG